jgi:hypothetical protein
MFHCASWHFEVVCKWLMVLKADAPAELHGPLVFGDVAQISNSMRRQSARVGAAMLLPSDLLRQFNAMTVAACAVTDAAGSRTAAGASMQGHADEAPSLSMRLCNQCVCLDASHFHPWLSGFISAQGRCSC